VGCNREQRPLTCPISVTDNQRLVLRCAGNRGPAPDGR